MNDKTIAKVRQFQLALDWRITELYQAIEAAPKSSKHIMHHGMHTAAVRRASMELTRALAVMRRHG